MQTMPIGTPAAASKPVSQAYDEADLDRAVQAYRFFYPTVSGAAIFKGSAKVGLVPNKVFGTLDSRPRHVGFTLNSDTPYAPLLLDLKDGPMVVELPAGPIVAVAMDVHQRWVADMGLPGPDAGKGGKHLFLSPGYSGEIPPGYHVATSTSYRMVVGARSIPVDGDVPGAVARLQAIGVRPLLAAPGGKGPTWLDLSPLPQDTTPLAYENDLGFWQELHEVIDTEPPYPPYRNEYGELAALGITKGRLFAPDDRMRRILTKAAQVGNAQMRVEAFADRRLDRFVWPDRQWEWAALRYEDGDFNAPSYVDLEARDKWFFQAIGASPAMFRRTPGAGSIYWLGLRDAAERYLDGGRKYKLTVPQPVPGKLFWSVTVYDSGTRSQVRADQERAALRSMFELDDADTSAPLDLHFGPSPPAGETERRRWVQTIPGRGWFAYFRVYGPEPAAFDGRWQPGDFEET